MRVLMVYPEFPNTFWSYKYALQFISKKASFPPLGLLTVAAMLPSEWEQKLVDINIRKLSDDDIAWADMVFISAMSVQSESAKKVIERCKKAGVKKVAGGPLFTAWPEKFDDVDYLVLNEAEITLPLFLEDLKKGTAEHIYTSEERPDMSLTPQPLFNLIDLKDYSSMNIQYSRGCPFNCEFCDIIVLFGHKPRLKSKEQVVDELQTLYDIGWRGSVFFVDDNFIGNKQKLKQEILPAIIDWSEKWDHPFSFHTEASINLADDEELMELMVQAGFEMVFVGIETPNEKSLIECNKNQNKDRDLLESIDILQNHGLEVEGGFILGFDSDPDSIFDTLIRFIQQSGIIVAMVGLLNAPRGTKLFERLQKQQRITTEFSGNNTDYSINFKPRMELNKLMDGYKKVVETIYSPENYYYRIREHFKKMRRLRYNHNSKMVANGLGAFFKSIFYLGIIGKERAHYWKLFFHTLFHHPSQLPRAITFAIFGYHFRKIYKI